MTCVVLDVQCGERFNLTGLLVFLIWVRIPRKMYFKFPSQVTSMWSLTINYASKYMYIIQNLKISYAKPALESSQGTKRALDNALWAIFVHFCRLNFKRMTNPWHFHVALQDKKQQQGGWCEPWNDRVFANSAITQQIQPAGRCKVTSENYR